MPQESMLLLDRKTQKRVADYLPREEEVVSLSALFTLFAEPTRLKILSALSLSELCVTDISRLLGMNQTTVSHQLKLLRDFGLIASKRQGKIIFYRVANSFALDLLYQGVELLGY